MATTYEPIATTTLGSAASSITFSSIPSTYTDLRLVVVGTGPNDNLIIRMNGVSSALYSGTRIVGDGNSIQSMRASNQEYILIGEQFRSVNPALVVADIFSYTSSSSKTVLFASDGDNNGVGEAMRGVGLFRNTSPITSLAVSMRSGNLYAGTTATIYGIKAA